MPQYDLDKSVTRAQHDARKPVTKVSKKQVENVKNAESDVESEDSDSDNSKKKRREVDKDPEEVENMQGVVLDEVQYAEFEANEKDDSSHHSEDESFEEFREESEDLPESVPRSRYERALVKSVRYTAKPRYLNGEGVTEQEYLSMAYEQFQGSQFYARQALFLPQDLLYKEDKKELKKNREPNIIEVPIHDLPENANVIGSYFG